MTDQATFRSLSAHLDPVERAQLLATLGPEEAEAVDLQWHGWAHEGQKCPDGDWRTWVVMAGRGFGKTRAGAEWIADLVQRDGSYRIALIGATIEDARSVMVDGASGLLAIAGDLVAKWQPSLRLLRFKSGAEARLFSSASPDGLRGPEHHFAWCDELAKWEKGKATWDMLQFGMRCGEVPRVLVTTTPKPGPVLSGIMAAKGTVVTGGKTQANPHLPDAYIETVEDLYAGTRLGRQELEGELLPDVAGALWSVELIERCRVSYPPQACLGEVASRSDDGGAASAAGELRSPPLHHPSGGPPPQASLGRIEPTRTIIGVDPPSGDGTCGIIACAIDADRIAHVLADHSVTARTPEGWAKAVVGAAELHGAKLIVAETNQGGEMVKAVLRGAGCDVEVKGVTAKLNKSDRATPIAQRFEAGKVWLHGSFPELEAELCGLIEGGGYEGPGRSPDRADAMVWALTELMLGKARAEARVRVL